MEVIFGRDEYIWFYNTVLHYAAALTAEVGEIVLLEPLSAMPNLILTEVLCS